MNIQEAISALEKSNEATGFLMVADVAYEEGWQETEELSALAVEIVTSEDFTVAAMAAAVFLQILENKQCQVVTG